MLKHKTKDFKFRKAKKKKKDKKKKREKGVWTLREEKKTAYK